MYSAVESPFTRFLRIFLITHEEEIPIFLGERFQQMAGEVRAAPDTGRLARLAEKLSAATWASVSLTPEVEGYLSHASSVALQEPGADIRGVIDFDDLPAAGYLYPGRLKLIRMVDEGQHLKDPSEVVEVRSIRAEVWAYTFDAVDPGLRAEKLLEVSSAAKGR